MKQNKSSRFKNWFFKVRIEKSEASKLRIENLSKEYDNGNILKVGK